MADFETFRQLKIRFSSVDLNPEVYNQLRAAVGWSTYQNSEVETGLRNSLFSVVALENEQPVGMGRVVGDGKLTFYIQDMIVLPAYQNYGIGFAIMKRVMDFIDAKSVEHSVIGLMAAVGKEGFYEQFGFIARPNERMGAGMNIWVKK